MQTFAARVLHDTLANSLGRILDISREQLRVSLWSGAPRVSAAAAAAATCRRCLEAFSVLLPFLSSPPAPPPLQHGALA